jgi:putative transposase
MIARWKKHMLEKLPSIFSENYKIEDKEADKVIEELYKQIGQLKVELDWIKKKSELLC